MNAPAHDVLAVVLAAGRGSRLRSSRPKVLHRVAGRPLLGWVLEAVRSAGCGDIAVVVGHAAESVREAFSGERITWVLQEELKGTGHALAQVEPEARHRSSLLVLSADVPLVRAATLRQLLKAARSGWASMAVADVDEPGSLDRVVTGAEGDLEAIVEAADASPRELAIGRVDAGLYVLPNPAIFDYLRAIDADGAKGELHLTEVLNAAARGGETIRLVELADPCESWGVDDRADLGRAHRALLRRRVGRLMEAGVSILDPTTTTIEATVSVARDTEIHSCVSLLGATSIGEDCTLEHGAWLRDCSVGRGSRIAPYSVLDGAVIGQECQIGPFARLRPGAVIANGAKIGNFVEVKNSELGEGVKANHLAYIGDTTVGEGTNLGAGVVTCNYDGHKKSATRIGRNTFIGSDTMLVAPVEIGDEAMTAAGSVVTKDVPPGALAVGRAQQRNVAEWARRFRRRKKR